MCANRYIYENLVERASWFEQCMKCSDLLSVQARDAQKCAVQLQGHFLEQVRCLHSSIKRKRKHFTNLHRRKILTVWSDFDDYSLPKVETMYSALFEYNFYGQQMYKQTLDTQTHYQTAHLRNVCQNVMKKSSAQLRRGMICHEVSALLPLPVNFHLILEQSCCQSTILVGG